MSASLNMPVTIRREKRKLLSHVVVRPKHSLSIVLRRCSVKHKPSDSELMFSTLSWFKQVEDRQRGDRLEGTHVHRPDDGLEITIVHRDGDSTAEATGLIV